MAIEKEIDAEKALADKETMSGLFVVGGQVNDFDNSDYPQLIKDYSAMRKEDSIAARSLDILKLPILQSEYRIECEEQSAKSQELIDYSYWCIDNIYKGFNNFKKHLLLSLDFGLSLFEIVKTNAVKYNKKLTNIIYYFSPIQLDTIYKHNYDSSSGIWQGISHYKRIPEGNQEIIEITKDKLFRYTYNEEFENVWGSSMYRPARKSFLLKTELIEAQVRAYQRMGLPHGTVYSGDLKNKAEYIKMLKTFVNSKNMYILDHEGKFKMTLDSSTMAGDPMPLIDLFNREMFFNTFSEFMVSGIGIGANGSRSSTSEHKGAYELAANAVLFDVENICNEMLNDMIDISYLAKVPKLLRPVLKFNTINQVDLVKVANNIRTLFDPAIGLLKKTSEDETFLRSTFGLPSVSKEYTATSETDADNTTDISSNDNIDKTKLNNKLRLPDDIKLSYETNVWNFKRAEDSFITAQDKVKDIIEMMMDKIGKSIIRQLEKSESLRDTNIVITEKGEFVDKLFNVYNGIKSSGFNDAKEEVTKLNKGMTLSNNIQLANTPSKKKKTIERKVDRLISEVKGSVLDVIERTSDERIAAKGGLRGTIGTYLKDSQKNAKRNLLMAVQDGYNEGRAEVFSSAGVTKYLYSARLDKNTCEECVPFDGVVVEKSELASLGLSDKMTSVNENCLGLLGNNACRCVLIPYEGD